MKILTFNNRQEWLEARTHGIGGSEVGIIMGANPYSTPRELAERKKQGLNGIIPEDNPSEDAMRGHDLEEAVVRAFERSYGTTVDKESADDFIVQDSKFPWRQASPDRFFTDNTAHKAILECKTTKRKIDPANIPLSWIYQVQYYMGITGRHTAYIAWYGFNYSFDYAVVKFDEETFGIIAEMVDKFWNDCVIGNEVPPAAVADEVMEEFPDTDPTKIQEVGQQQMEDWKRLREVRSIISEFKDEEEFLTNQLKVSCNDAEVYTANGQVLYTYRPTNSTRIDTAKLKKEHPDIAEECTSTTSSRRLTIKEPKL